MGATVTDRTGVPAAGPTKPKRLRRGFTARDRRDFPIFLILALPNILLIMAFIYRPLITNIYYSTLNWTLGSKYATPIGLGNYREFFTDPDSLGVLKTTAIFTVATVGGSMVLGLMLATVLNRPLRGRTLARATVFAPYVLSGVGIGLVWVFIFDPVVGVLGAVLRAMGGTSPEWFNKPGLSLVMVIIVYVWKNTGYCAVIYLAAMQAVPKDLLEAASIDGASSFRTFRSVVLPLLSPTTFFLLLTTMLSSLQAFDLIRIMTPLGNGTTTLMYDAYLQAFGGYNRAGYSAAVATILFAILLVMTVVQLSFIERKVHYA
ncbi:carbohydrate ABC transporter permease [Nakamurella lactea]|uniref:carbohydrate ABC transporter permease n=1 Tax=Nakamurella lactea TaxID=459515 RepID=UPI0004081447|nr:sugar ABC transporter permease [Nakamurella lactea]